MARVIENTAGKIRNKPIKDTLKTVLITAAEAAGVDTVSVTSGGQDELGKGTRRTGSTRHDAGNAADLQLLRAGRVLDFDDQRSVFEAFVTAAAGAGATGLGAGVDYMGTKTIHVGFGSKLVWGAGGRAVNAPTWLKRAAEKGWSGGAAAAAPAAAPPPKATLGRNRVNARTGVRLRGGPGLEFGHATTLAFGSELTVIDFDDRDPRWAQVDIEDDGRTDGFVFAAFLTPLDSEDESGG